MITIPELTRLKQEKQKFACLALYDAAFARLAEEAGVKLLLVGDSLGMVLHNKHNTLHVGMDDMRYHTGCVAAGAEQALIMADMPFASYTTPALAQQNAAQLIRAGAHLVKLEGGKQLAEIIPALRNTGIPVCAHLGLTPQFVNFFGGFKSQGKEPEQADQIYEASMFLIEQGANMLLLECVPAQLAKVISNESPVPVIGIGAGWDTDAQVLVAYDALGLNTRKQPRFVRNFLDGAESIQGALAEYVRAVENLDFPTQEHSY